MSGSALPPAPPGGSQPEEPVSAVATAVVFDLGGVITDSPMTAFAA